MKKLIFIFMAVVLANSLFASALKRGITAEDLYLLKEISDVQISPDGQRIAYVQQKIDKEKNTYNADIWIMSITGGEPLQLTKSPAVDKSPCWSPDGKYIAFVSNRSGKNQIWLISLAGGEAWNLTDMANGAWSPAWSPDANYIAFLSRTDGLKEDSSKDSQSSDRWVNELGREYARDVRVITRLRYREGTQYLDNSRTHLWVVSVNGGQPRQLTFGNYDDRFPVWSPDSEYLAFVSNRQGNADFDDNTDICLVRAEGGVVNILTQSPGYDREPAWSPDGEYLAYVGNTRLNDYTEQANLWIIPKDGGPPANLTASFDRDPSRPLWSGKQLYFLAADQGNVHLYAVPSKGGEAKRIIGGNRQITSYDISKNGKTLAFISSENTNPSDLFVAATSGKNERRLTEINKDFLNQVSLVEPEETWYPSFDGRKIHGWVMKPLGFKPGKQYPMIVEIHGGPYWHYGNVWFQEFQLLAARGYVVFYCNPRISTSYGQEFVGCCRGQWGEGDYQDIMKGVDYVLKMGFVDSTRMGVTGGSYGGYMTNWIIGHTNRFKAAVTERSLSNLISFYGTTDIQNFIEFEFGKPWQALDTLINHSPITYVDKINTPLLIIHSELDYRVPISQAEELFVSLKRRGIEVEFVRYPQEGHNLSRSGQPLHRVDRLNRIVDWFDKYLMP